MMDIEIKDDSPAAGRIHPETGNVLHPVSVATLHEHISDWYNDHVMSGGWSAPHAYLEIAGELRQIFLISSYNSGRRYAVWTHGVRQVWRGGDDVAWIERPVATVSEPMSLELVAGDLLQREPVANVEPIRLVVISDAYTLSPKGWAMAESLKQPRVVLTDKARALLQSEAVAS